MKFLKYLDFFAQSLMFAAALSVITFQTGKDVVILVLWMQLLVGPWQVLSSLISVGVQGPLHTVKQIHLIISAIYLTILFISPIRQLPESAALIVLMVPAWTLAVFYYLLTILATFRRPARQSSFLPHTSF